MDIPGYHDNQRSEYVRSASPLISTDQKKQRTLDNHLENLDNTPDFLYLNLTAQIGRFFISGLRLRIPEINKYNSKKSSRAVLY